MIVMVPLLIQIFIYTYTHIHRILHKTLGLSKLPNLNYDLKIKNRYMDANPSPYLWQTHKRFVVQKWSCFYKEWLPHGTISELAQWELLQIKSLGGWGRVILWQRCSSSFLRTSRVRTGTVWTSLQNSSANAIFSEASLAKEITPACELPSVSDSHCTAAKLQIITCSGPLAYMQYIWNFKC